jgi:hypothetical protein
MGHVLFPEQRDQPLALCAQERQSTSLPPGLILVERYAEAGCPILRAGDTSTELGIEPLGFAGPDARHDGGAQVGRVLGAGWLSEGVRPVCLLELRTHGAIVAQA